MHSNQLIACPHCGAKVAAPTAKFCTSCGKKLQQRPSSPSLSTPVQPTTDENSLTGSRPDFKHYPVERKGRLGLFGKEMCPVIRDQGGNILLISKSGGKIGWKFKVFDSKDMEVGRIDGGNYGKNFKIFDQSNLEIASISNANIGSQSGDLALDSMISGGKMSIQTPQGIYTVSGKFIAGGIVHEAIDEQGELAFQLIELSDGQLRIESKGNINPTILGMICIPLLVKLKIEMKARKRGFYDPPIKNPEPVILVDDPIYNEGRIPAIFRIKRKEFGEKFEIKDGNNKQVLIAVLAIEKGFRYQHFKMWKKIKDEAKVGIFRDMTLYTLHDAQKQPMGEISLNTAFFQVNPAHHKPLIIKDSYGKNLAFLNAPFKARLLDGFTTSSGIHDQSESYSLANKGEIYPDQFHVETSSGHFEIDVVQKIRGRIFKFYHALNVDVLNPQRNKSLSIIERKKNNYEMTLYQGLSPFVAQSIAFLISHVVWLPPGDSID
ncbi:MAG: zinc ribbon domain-containing protein [Candidatus Hodarchaeales archaeon]|jgi:hypothetical protein